ncbi:hypothetical protein D3C75_984980 [compost metagenome]
MKHHEAIWEIGNGPGCDTLLPEQPMSLARRSSGHVLDGERPFLLQRLAVVDLVERFEHVPVKWRQHPAKQRASHGVLGELVEAVQWTWVVALSRL